MGPNSHKNLKNADQPRGWPRPRTPPLWWRLLTSVKELIPSTQNPSQRRQQPPLVHVIWGLGQHRPFKDTTRKMGQARLLYTRESFCTRAGAVAYAMELLLTRGHCCLRAGIVWHSLKITIELFEVNICDNRARVYPMYTILHGSTSYVFSVKLCDPIARAYTVCTHTYTALFSTQRVLGTRLFFKWNQFQSSRP